MSHPETNYLADLVEDCLAKRGMPGTVRIRPHKPLAARLESGERARFLIEYDGVGTARLRLDEYDIAGGTVRASVVTALADAIERERRLDRQVA